MTEGSNVAQDQIKAYVDRVLRMKEEAKAINADIREIYAEAKASGFDKTVLGKLVTYVEKRQSDSAAVMETEALFDLYLTAYDGAVGKVGTKRATHTHAPEKPDPIAALKADPALAIVAASEIKKPIPQPSKAAGSDLTTSQPLNGQVADIPEAKASKDSGATEQDIETPADSVTGDVSRASVGAGTDAPIQPETANEADDGLVTSPGDAADHGSVGTGNDARNDNAGGSNVAAGSAPIVAEEGAQNASAATPLYPEPGVVYWESSPPEGVERHEYSAAFGTMGQDIAVIEDDLARSKAEPIVKIGNVILDGWARYMAARGMVGLDGQPVEYSVVQYDGRDPLLDCIRWNLAGRILTEDQKRIICAKLVKLYPQRKGPIWGAFEFGMELV